ncbi:hypothetical protein [Amycolatopsis sacchari]|uniref:hypothetical protein n=1 Tax=Amycolatopsis sacchari TaxID=115433 RepID=UPI003D73D7DA
MGHRVVGAGADPPTDMTRRASRTIQVTMSAVTLGGIVLVVAIICLTLLLERASR